jgi:hypothetical protein
VDPVSPLVLAAEAGIVVAAALATVYLGLRFYDGLSRAIARHVEHMKSVEGQTPTRRKGAVKRVSAQDRREEAVKRAEDAGAYWERRVWRDMTGRHESDVLVRFFRCKVISKVQAGDRFLVAFQPDGLEFPFDLSVSQATWTQLSVDSTPFQFEFVSPDGLKWFRSSCSLEV